MSQGKRSSIYGKTKRDCFNKLCLKRGLDAISPSSDITLGQWLDEWLEVHKKIDISNSSYVHYESIIRLHVQNSLKNQPLNEVGALTLQQNINSISTSKMRVETYNVLNGAFKKAMHLDLIYINPMDKISKPKHLRKNGEALSSYELGKFLEDIKGHVMENYFKFLLFTGTRRSEALAVTWEDVSFEFDFIKIHGTKTVKSEREVPLMEELKKVLSAMEKKEENLFPFSPELVSKTFHKFVNNHKLHDLRHTFASRCLECGIAMKVVQKWLGHSNIATTGNIYSHVSNRFAFKQSKLFKL